MHRILAFWTILQCSVCASAFQGEPIQIISEQVAGNEGNATFTRNFEIILTTADGIQYQGRGAQRIGTKLMGSLSGCSHNMPASAPIFITGRKDGGNIVLSVTVDLPREHFQIRCSNSGGNSTLPMGPSGGQITIPFQDNYVLRTQYPGLRSVVKLQRACSGTGVAKVDVVDNFPRRVFDPTYYSINNTLTGAEITNLKKEQDPDEPSVPENITENAGLAVVRLPKIIPEVDKKPAAIGSGTCAWLGKLQFTYPKANIYIDSKYRPGTCNYRVSLEHEELHYQDWITLSTAMYSTLSSELQLLGVPLFGTPKWFPSEGQVDAGVDALLRPALMQIVGVKLKQALKKQTKVRDTREQKQLVWAKCESW